MEKKKYNSKIIINDEEIDNISKNKFKKYNNESKKKEETKTDFNNSFYFYYLLNKSIIIFLFICFFYILKKFITKDNIIKSYTINKNENELIPKENILNITLETYDLNVLEQIENAIKDYIELTPDEMRFFNGLLRKVKPKKVVEIGISKGGSTALILNALKDIEGAKLYSIDINKMCYRNKYKNSGFLIDENFPELKKNWKLFLGGITAEFIESIGGGIDLAFIDTMHITPWELLDLLMVLPFLKNEAIIVMHDAFFLYYNKKVKRDKIHTSNNEIMTYVRGDLILPSYGDKVFFRNIGAIKLSPEQNNYYYQYFLALGIQWEYMPSEKHLKIMREFFMKYYGQKYVEIYDDAVEKNKIYLNKR